MTDAYQELMDQLQQYASHLRSQHQENLCGPDCPMCRSLRKHSKAQRKYIAKKMKKQGTKQARSMAAKLKQQTRQEKDMHMRELDWELKQIRKRKTIRDQTKTGK